jgi:hypothetical protein
MAHYVCVTGGRDFVDTGECAEVLDFLCSFYGDDLRVMHGDARGLDRAFAAEARARGVRIKAFPADWYRHPKAAGPIRNGEMVRYLQMCASKGHSVQVIAFPGGTGTADMIRQAERAGIAVDQV